MTKAKLDTYINKLVSAKLKDGKTIDGRIRKIKDIYIIGRDIQLIPSSIAKLEVKPTSQEIKILEREKLEEHLFKEVCQTKINKVIFTSYKVRYGHLNGKNINLVKSFKTLEEAKNFKSICEKNINEIKFAKNSIEEIKNGCVVLEYPETLLHAIGINPSDYENYYNEIVPNFEENYNKLCADTLQEKETGVLTYYYKNKMSLEEIGKVYGVTRERIRQIIKRALVKLKHSRAKTIITDGNHQYELINAKEREELYLKIKREMSYELALEIIEQHKREERDNWEQNVESPDIVEMDLSIRSYRGLKRAGINTISELTSLSEDKVIRIRNLGKKCLKEIKMKLNSLGLSLKQEEYL